MDVERRRELDAAKILVIQVAQLVQHVAVNGVGDPRMYQREKILIVEGPDDLVLPHGGERDERRLAVRRYFAGG